MKMSSHREHATFSSMISNINNCQGNILQEVENQRKIDKLMIRTLRNKVRLKLNLIYILVYIFWYCYSS